MKITEAHLVNWLEAVTSGDMSLSRMAELINERQFSLTDSDFFSGVKQQYGIDIPKSERFSFCANAGREITDLRWLLAMHPDQKMVETSCLHFLGDEAQIWWKENEERLNGN